MMERSASMYNHHLETFICAVEKGSFAKAAEELYVSHNAVMKQINLLESHLNLRLFRRSSRGLTLTPAGELIYREAKAMIKRSNKALAQAHALAAQEEVTIRVGSSLMRPGRAVVDLWQGIREQCPEIKLRMVPFDDDWKSYQNTIDSLGKEIDVIFGLFPPSSLRGSCSLLELGRAPLCCGIPMKHPLAAHEQLNVQDLYGKQLHILRRGSSPDIDALRDFLLQNHPQIQLTDLPDYDMDVLRSFDTIDGIVITAEIWKYAHPSLVTIPVDWEFSVPYGLLYSKHPTEVMKRFVETIRVNKTAN